MEFGSVARRLDRGVETLGSAGASALDYWRLWSAQVLAVPLSGAFEHAGADWLRVECCDTSSRALVPQETHLVFSRFAYIGSEEAESFLQLSLRYPAGTWKHPVLSLEVDGVGSLTDDAQRLTAVRTFAKKIEEHDQLTSIWPIVPASVEGTYEP